MNNLVLSPSALNDAQVCPKLYYYKYTLGKEPTEQPSHLQEGSLLHKVFEIYYNHKIKGESIAQELLFELGRNYAAKNLTLSSELVESTIKDCKMYFDYYEEQGSTWLIEEVEEPFAKELYSGNNIRIIISGKADLRVRSMDGKGPRIIIDHKYEGQFRKPKERDNQPLCYSWAFETRDFIYNRIGKQKSYKPKDRLARPWINYLDHQIEEWVESAIYTALEIMKFIENDYWPSRMMGCNIYGKKCTFHDVCNTTPDNREYRLKGLFGPKKKFRLMEKEE